MKVPRPQLPFVVSAIYFALVSLVLFWYESCLGVSENGGIIPGLILVALTFPSVFLSDWAPTLVGCTRYSTCEHVVGSLFAGALNALFIFAVLRIFILVFGKKNAA